MQRTQILLAAFLLLAGIGLSAPPARAQWCAETTVTVLPATAAPGTTTAFSILVRNSGTEATVLTSVEAHFSWEAASRVLPGGIVEPSASETFTVTPSATPTGTTVASVEVRLEGFRTNPTTDGDVCTEELSITIVSVSDDGMLASAFLGLVLLAVLIVIVVGVIAVVLVVATRRKPQAPPPYATSYPPPGPPPQPPTPPTP